MTIQQQIEIRDLKERVASLEQKLQMVCDYLAANAPDVEVEEPKKTRQRKVNGSEAH